MDELENSIANLQKKIAGFSQGTVIPPADKTSIPLQDEKLISLKDLDDIAGKKPSRYLLPDGEFLDISIWKDILRESCKFALEHTPSISIPFPDRVGKKVSLFSFEEPANKVSFITEQYNGQKIYIYLNYDSHNCVANALYILEQVPEEFMKVPPSIVIRN